MHIFHDWDKWTEFTNITGWVTQYRKCKICGYKQTWSERLAKIIAFFIIIGILFICLCQL